jgi:hypothetical protein
MASESSGKHAWVPIIVAIITSAAAVVGAWIGTDAKSQIRALVAEKEQLKDKLATSASEKVEAEKELNACLGEVKLLKQEQPNRQTPPNGVVGRREPPVDLTPRPIEVATVRVRIRIPPGYDQAAVYLDGTLKPIAKRSLYWLELEAPRKTEPTFVRLEARGRPTCEKLTHLQATDDGIAIC